MVWVGTLITKLLAAHCILPIKESLKSMSVGLMKRIFLVNSPVRSLCSFLMSKHLITGKYSKCTLFGRLLDMSLSSLLSGLSKFKYTQKYSARDGVVDSLQDVLYKDEFLNGNSSTYIYLSYWPAFNVLYCDISYLWYACMYVIYMFSSLVGVLINT